MVLHVTPDIHVHDNIVIVAPPPPICIRVLSRILIWGRNCWVQSEGKAVTGGGCGREMCSIREVQI